MGGIRLSAVTKIYRSSRGAVHALDDLSFSATQNEFVEIVGPSGCGKSTLLRLIAGLLRPSTGQISFPDWQDEPSRRMLFQEHSQFPWLTVLDNVAFGLEMESVPKSIRYQRAHAFLEALDLSESANRYPHELSGGMCQRVALAGVNIPPPHYRAGCHRFTSPIFRRLDLVVEVIVFGGTVG